MSIIDPVRLVRYQQALNELTYHIYFLDDEKFKQKLQEFREEFADILDEYAKMGFVESPIKGFLNRR